MRSSEVNQSALREYIRHALNSTQFKQCCCTTAVPLMHTRMKAAVSPQVCAHMKAVLAHM